MSTRTYYLVFISLLFLYSCKQGNETNGELSTSWELITNQFNDKDLCESNLQITNNGESAITNDFRIYFNFCRYIHPELSSGPFKIEHINGDFFRLSLKPNIKIQPGQTISQTLVSDYWAIKESVHRQVYMQ
jgi:hexosaminidase